MKIFRVNKNIEIVCEYKKTRNGFKHTATLLYKAQERESVKVCYLNRTWERYTFESVLEKLAEETTTLSDKEKKLFQKFIKNGARVEDDMMPLKSVAMVAMLGNVFGKTQKDKNDWKERILKAGLENKGLIMPDDWGKLSEGDRQARLDGAIKRLA